MTTQIQDYSDVAMDAYLVGKIREVYSSVSNSPKIHSGLIEIIQSVLTPWLNNTNRHVVLKLTYYSDSR